jgi:uncharacterized membrane protein
MSKQDFLKTLERLLGNMPEDDKKEILYDYEEHFRIALEKGKTENEIIKSLGDVNDIARQYKADFSIRKAESYASAGNVTRAILATMWLGLFNVVVVLIPFVILSSILTGFFTVSIGLTIGGIGSFAAACFYPLISNFINLDISIPFVLFASIGIFCLGMLSFIGSCYLLKYFFKGLIKYLKWNQGIITNK